MKICPLILVCMGACILAGQAPPPSAIRVQVINSLTQNPVVSANVVLSGHAEELSSGRTDAAGVFVGHVGSAGSYLCTVTRHGYRMRGIGMGKLLEVKGKAQTDITIELEPLAVLTGRVLDQYGDPVRNAIVRTEDKLQDPGEGEYYNSSSAATTDDRGEYRLAEVEPGKHYVAVEFNSSDRHVRSLYQWPQSGGLVLYPDATAIEQAQKVEVSAGATLRLHDMRLRIQRAVPVQGRVKPSSSSGQQQVSLRRTLELALHSSPMIQGGVAEPDGTFRIEALPGTYELTASDAKTGRISKPVILEIRDQDVTGLELELSAGYEIRGRVAVEGPQQVDYASLLLNFGGQPVKLDAGGGFRTDVLRDTAVYTLQGLTDGWYVKDFRVSGKPISGRRFRIEPGTTDVVISLSPRGGRVSISLSGLPDGQAVSMIVLLPESGEIADVESIISAEPDASGRYVAHAVPPGSYRIFTLDAASWALVMRPNLLLEKYRNLALLVAVHDGEDKSVVIPFQHLNVE